MFDASNRLVTRSPVGIPNCSLATDGPTGGSGGNSALLNRCSCTSRNWRGVPVGGYHWRATCSIDISIAAFNWSSASFCCCCCCSASSCCSIRQHQAALGGIRRHQAALGSIRLTRALSAARPASNSLSCCCRNSRSESRSILQPQRQPSTLYGCDLSTRC